MIGRSTPFGLFAGTIRGIIDERTELRIGGTAEARLRIRPDGVVLHKALRALMDERQFRESVPLQLNQSAYEWGGRLRYIESFLASERPQPYARSTAAIDAPLRLVMTRTRSAAPANFATLVEMLVREGFARSDASAYVDQLIDEQVLVAPASMPLICAEPATAAARDATRYASAARVTEDLDRIVRTTMEASVLPLPEALEPLARVHEDSIAAGFAASDDTTTDVQLEFAGTIVVGDDLVPEIETLANLLARIHIPAPTSPNGWLARELEEFAHGFEDRFGDAAVPIALAIDPDIGVGFQGAGVIAPSVPDVARRVGERETHLMNRVVQTLVAGESILHLSAEDTAVLETDRSGALPTSAILAVRVAITSDRRRRIYASKFGGPSSSSTFGRFASDTGQLAGDVRQLHSELATTHDVSGIDAEIIHAPTGDLVNIAARPLLREYEIPILGRGSAERTRTIPCDDLLVTIQRERVVLYSRRHQCVVRPHLTCAHAASHNMLPPMYRFLFAVALQGSDPTLMWQWGEELDALTFLPRVERNGMILGLARWRLTQDDLGPLVKSTTMADRVHIVESLREKLKLPRFVVAMTGSDELVFDLTNPAQLDALSSFAKKRNRLELTELFPQPDESAMTGEEGGYMHELFIPLRLSGARDEQAPYRFHPDMENGVASFVGDEWLYFRIRLGPHAADALLLDYLSSVIAALQKAGDIEEWFFVRYADPFPHLRVRMRGKPAQLLSRALPALTAGLRSAAAAGINADLRLDSYRPELRRYGGVSAMRCCERLFYASSLIVIDALQYASDNGVDHDPDWRMTFGCVSTQLLLDCLMPNDDSRLEMLGRIAANAVAEGLTATDTLMSRRRAFAQALRPQRRELMAALFDDAPEWLFVRHSAVVHLSKARAAISELQCLSRDGRLTTAYDNIVQSLLHMHLNRVFADEPRQHERVVYDFLHQLNRSRLAKQAVPGITRRPPTVSAIETSND
jgi:thiopeptide-type bacteriocin biosynthesis protein